MAIQLKNSTYTNTLTSTSQNAFVASGNMALSAIVLHESPAGGTVTVTLKNAAEGTTINLGTHTTTGTGTQVLSAPLGMQAGDAIWTSVSRTGPTVVFSYALSTADLSGVALDALSDTNVPAPTTNDVLTWNGTSWVSSAPSGGGAVDSVNGQTGVVSLSMDDIDDVLASSPSSGDVLSYNVSGNWIVDSGLTDFKSMLKSDVGSNSFFNTLNDTTKGYLTLNSDGFVLGKNNSAINVSENSPTIMDFDVQDDGVTPAQITAMRVTNEVGQSSAPQVIVGGSTAQGSNTLTVSGTQYNSGAAVFNSDLTVNGSLNATISTQQISDINPSSPASGQVLKYVGSEWINATDAAAFQRVAVSGQSTVIANDNKSTLSLAAGTGMSITTDAGTDTVTIAQDTPYSYLYTNGAASATWSVSHNLDTTSPVVQCYDDAGDQIIPQNIAITDANNLVITWGASQDGRAIIGGGTWASNPIPNVVFVGSAGDFPTPSAGVITLAANVTYFITDDIDLGGDRLVGSANTTIIGGSSENCKITSTGLGVGVALFTTAWTTPIRHVTFYGVDTAIDIEGVTNAPVALDWTGMNFKDVPNIGTIDTCDNFIYSKGAILNSKGLVFDGTVGTVGIDNSIAVGSGAAGSIMELASTATITRRFRIIYSSIIAFGSTTGIDIDSLATVPTESFILDTVNFSGGGTYLPDVDHTSNEARFENCKGITNTSVNGQMYMQGNATATTISATSTFYKVAGATSASADNAKFTETDNRLTCDATLPRKFMLTCHLSFTAGNNQDVEFGFYDSTLSAVRTPSRTVTTTDGGGSAQNVGFSCVTTMEDLDYIEIHCANKTSTTNVTVTNMNVLITEV